MLSKVIAGWVALAVIMTSATQLRPTDTLPVGVGEAMLAVWMLFVGFCLLRKVPFGQSDMFRVVTIYWTLALILLAAGSIVAALMNKQDVETARHDALAFALVGPLTCLLAIRIGNVSDRQYYLSMARALLFSAGGITLVLLVASLMSPYLGPISLWYVQVRYRGWADNPNQLALFMLPMPFLGWYLVRQSEGLGRKLACLLAIVPCVITGWMTQSDSLRVSWAGAAAIVALWLWYRILARGRGQFIYVSHVIVPAVGLTVAVMFGSELIDRFLELSEQIYEKGHRGSIGLSALMNGLAAIGRSPLVGWGPGAYSGIYRPFDGFEAHNTLIDWGMSTGVLGMALYLGLLLWCTLRIIRARSPWLLAALATVVADSVFGYSMRQPMFWLMLVLVSGLSEQPARRAVPATRLTPGSLADTAERPAYLPSARRFRREPSASATRTP